MGYLQEYGALLIFVGLVVGIPMMLLMVSFAGSLIKARPQRSSPVKREAYESGMRPFSKKPSRFSFRYYYFALLFIIFDVETVLLFPVAVSYGVVSSQFGIAVLVALLVFLLVVTLPFLYAWSRGTLEWN